MPPSNLNTCLRSVRSSTMTFSGVASNFAGLPLAFAFLATLGRTGIVTTLLITLFDFNIYRAGFNLLSFWGLTLTYLYFQIPLMVLIITPALDGLARHAARQGDQGGRHVSVEPFDRERIDVPDVVESEDTGIVRR